MCYANNRFDTRTDYDVSWCRFFSPDSHNHSQQLDNEKEISTKYKNNLNTHIKNPFISKNYYSYFFFEFTQKWKKYHFTIPIVIKITISLLHTCIGFLIVYISSPCFRLPWQVNIIQPVCMEHCAYWDNHACCEVTMATLPHHMDDRYNITGCAQKHITSERDKCISCEWLQTKPSKICIQLSISYSQIQM